MPAGRKIGRHLGEWERRAAGATGGAWWWHNRPATKGAGEVNPPDAGSGTNGPKVERQLCSDDDDPKFLDTVFTLQAVRGASFDLDAGRFALGADGGGGA